MNVPLSYIDINIWLALQTFLLLITVELLSPRYSEINILVDMKRLKKATIFIATLFFINIMIYFVYFIIL